MDWFLDWPADTMVPTPRAFQEIDNLLVRIHFIIEMISWTGLASWEFEFPFPGSLISTLLGAFQLSPSSFHQPSRRHQFVIFAKS